MPPTLRELIESNTRLADSNLGLSHAINKQADAFDRLRPSFEQLRRDLFDLKNNHTLDQANLSHVLTGVGEKLAIILDTVKTSEDDLKQVAKEVTHPRILLPEQKDNQVERVIKTFEKLSATTKLIILIIILVAGASGWFTHLLKG